MSKTKIGKLAIILAICAIFVGYHWFGLEKFLSFESLKENQAALAALYQEQPFLVGGLFVLIYMLTTAVSLPGATILTLGGGAVFGLAIGTVLVSISSTIGATLAFLGSRFLFGDLVQRKFSTRVEAINKGLKKEGGFYLFTLRLVPLFPFFLINLVMGLTPIRVLTFFLVSLVGMFPGTIVYVNAGTELAKIDTLSGILSPNLIFSFVMIGILPLLAKAFISKLKSGKQMRKYKKPSKFDFNILVIGGGSAGLVSAYIAAAVKAKVGLIEKHKMGGDCLNTGCVPSKALIRSAKMLSYFKRSQEFGIDALPVKLDFAKVMDRVQRVVTEIAPHDSKERYAALGVECISGEARIKSPYEIEVNGKILTTKNIVVATGASPFVPPIPGLSELAFLTSDNVWNLRTLPPRLIVLGGGPIGCELAQSFARFGSKVTLVEMAPRIMAREDVEASELVVKKFESEGIKVLVNHKALRIDKASKVLICESAGREVGCENAEREVSIPFDEILVALGRKANVKGFGLEELGVEVSEHGTVATDEYLRTTNFPNIYACGDVAGPYQFTHVASHQAWYVAVNALFSPFKKFKADYRVVPWCTFTDPEVARVGLNEQEAREKKIEYLVSKYDIQDLDRAITEGEAYGFVKVLTPPGSDKILGVTIVGDHAGDIIAEYVAAMKHGIGLNKILSTIHIYPTLAEANKYVAGVWKRANAPQKTLEWLRKFHAWRRG